MEIRRSSDKKTIVPPGHFGGLEADAVPDEFNAASALAQGIWTRLTTWPRRLFGWD